MTNIILRLCNPGDALSWQALVLGAISLVVAAAIWLPLLHFFFRPPLPPPKDESEVEPLASRLAAQQLYLWTDSDSRQALPNCKIEWERPKEDEQQRRAVPDQPGG